MDAATAWVVCWGAIAFVGFVTWAAERMEGDE
jgi:hypothetical protein